LWHFKHACFVIKGSKFDGIASSPTKEDVMTAVALPNVKTLAEQAEQFDALLQDAQFCKPWAAQGCERNYERIPRLGFGRDNLGFGPNRTRNERIPREEMERQQLEESRRFRPRGESEHRKERGYGY
jgi:hypothetical protein